jgi:lipid-A-disaccharide synthase-like uncharacterized protein
MNEVIGNVLGVTLTPWKLVGYVGMLMFTSRWIIQFLATRRHGRPVIPRTFWIMSLAGCAMLSSYFIWGKNDSVGILSNLFPAAVALYNLILDIKAGRRR